MIGFFYFYFFGLLIYTLSFLMITNAKRRVRIRLALFNLFYQFIYFFRLKVLNRNLFYFFKYQFIWISTIFNWIFLFIFIIFFIRKFIRKVVQQIVIITIIFCSPKCP